VIATELKPANASTTEFRLALNETKGVQEATEYETEGKKVKAILETEGAGHEAFSPEQTGFGSSAASITAAKATEVKAALASTGLPEFTGSGGEEIAYPREFKASTGGSASFWIETFPWNFREATVTGEITGPNEVADVVLKFKGASPAAYGCTSNGLEGEAGELVTNDVIGRLGYLNKTAKTVGLLLEAPGGVIAKCSGYQLGSQEILGSVIGKLTAVAGGHSFALEFKKGGKGEEQEFTKFEGEEATHQLENYWVPNKKHGKMSMGTSGLGFETSKVTELKA